MNNQLKPSAFVGYTNFDLTINLENNENINDRITVDKIFRNLGGMAANTACFSSYLGNNSFIFSYHNNISLHFSYFVHPN